MPRDSSSPSGETTSTSTGHLATLRNHRFFGPSGHMGSLSRTAAPGHMLLPNPLQAEGGHDAPSEIETRKIAMGATAWGRCASLSLRLKPRHGRKSSGRSSSKKVCDMRWARDWAQSSLIDQTPSAKATPQLKRQKSCIRNRCADRANLVLGRPQRPLLQDGHLDALALRQRHHRPVALADHKHVGQAGGEGVARRVLQVDNVEGALVPLA